MPRVPSLRIGVLTIAFAVAVYGATTLVDRVVTDIVTTTQSPSAPWPESLWLINVLLLPLLPLALAFFYGSSLGGAPLAVLAIVLDAMSRTREMRWSRVPASCWYGGLSARVVRLAA